LESCSTLSVITIELVSDSVDELVLFLFSLTENEAHTILLWLNSLSLLVLLVEIILLHFSVRLFEEIGVLVVGLVILLIELRSDE
jgi:hypothetical protein